MKYQGENRKSLVIVAGAHNNLYFVPCIEAAGTGCSVSALQHDTSVQAVV